MSENTEKITGTVKRITYKNMQNGYTVAAVLSNEELITVVGSMPFITDGDEIEATGFYTVHPTYGSQFKAQTVTRTVPDNAASVFRYLSCGNIKGVGPATARKIVEKFGESTTDILKDTPERLTEIKGISLARAIEIGEDFKNQFGVRDVIIMLSKFKISTEDALNVYKKLGRNSIEIIEKNPFVLCGENIALPFEKAEEIAEYYNFPRDGYERIFAGIDFVLHRNLLNGHTCLPKDKLLSVASNLLECGINNTENVYEEMVASFNISEYTCDGNIYSAIPKYLNAEDYISSRLICAKNQKSTVFMTDDSEINHFENEIDIQFDELQREAIKYSCIENIFILTGGPGTGKTTTLKAIIAFLKRRNLEILLAAPTGRAAKRMSELTGEDATTLHRLLEVDWSDEEDIHFVRNELNPLKCDAIIIDEMSMVDTLLFESLLRALPMNCKIILVGDSDQLPSVSAGNVLNDLILSDAFPSIRLNYVFRQAGESAIVRNAHSVINNGKIDLSLKDSDFFFIKKNTADDVAYAVTQLCSERLPKAYNFNPLTDIQVLCPSKKMQLGTYNLNIILQNCLNPSDKNPEIPYKGFKYRVGDKVMQIKNNYELVWKTASGEEGNGVYNGDVGFINSIDRRNDCIEIQFDDKTVNYTTEELNQIEPAYAVTVHKSQGSEYNCVIIPVFDTPSKLRYRNLLYTAITRAKKLLILVGNEQVINDMIQNDRKTLRYTRLSDIIGDKLCKR